MKTKRYSDEQIIKVLKEQFDGINQKGTRSCNQVSLAKLKGRYSFYGCQSKPKFQWPQMAETIH